jgi:hypothetical protein
VLGEHGGHEVLVTPEPGRTRAYPDPVAVVGQPGPHEHAHLAAGYLGVLVAGIPQARDRAFQGQSDRWVEAGGLFVVEAEVLGVEVLDAGHVPAPPAGGPALAVEGVDVPARGGHVADRASAFA